VHSSRISQLIFRFSKIKVK